MATTFTLISSTTLTGSQATVTFSSIPSTYTDLCLKISARNDDTSAFGVLYMQFNGSGGTAYSRTILRGSGSAVISARSSSTSEFQSSATGVVGGSATANTFSSAEFYIPSYTASQNKPTSYFGVNEDNATAAYMGTIANLWQNNSAISSISVYLSGVNFVSGSSFYLYGIKNS